MANPALDRLIKKTGQHHLLEGLDKLSLSELNSLLMEVFRLKAHHLEPQHVVKNYKSNRFTLPSSINPVQFLEEELQLMKIAERHGFRVMEFSPLAPLGSCSSIALVDQNKIISAIRGTEAVADVTNVMALEASVNRKALGFDKNTLHYCAAHRHVRSQMFSGKGFSAHFKIFCAVSSGPDSGSAYDFEKKSTLKHLQMYCDYFAALKLPHAKIVIKSLTAEGVENRLAPLLSDYLSGSLEGADVSCVNVPMKDHQYYRDVRFSINLVYEGTEYNIGDGGFVDWGEKLTGNKKERMLTSGIGTEFLYKLMNQLL